MGCVVLTEVQGPAAHLAVSWMRHTYSDLARSLATRDTRPNASLRAGDDSHTSACSECMSQCEMGWDA
jgi:hypothetical protein